MINERLRDQIAPADLPLAIGPIAEFVVTQAALAKAAQRPLRFFLRYTSVQPRQELRAHGLVVMRRL